MKKQPLAAIFFASATVVRFAAAEDSTNAPAPGAEKSTNTVATTKVQSTETLTCQATAFCYGSGSAFFTTTGIGDPRGFEVGQTVAGDLKLAKVSFKTVTLTNASANTFVLAVGQSLRREGDGPWHLFDFNAVTPMAITNVVTTVSSAPASGGAADSILEKLRKKRESRE